MASFLESLVCITSSTAHAYFLAGQNYHSLPSPIRHIRNEFTVSSTRELPDLITVFGMLEERLLRARAALLGGDECWMWKEMCVANELVNEAWWKVSWLDSLVTCGGRGYGEEEGEESGNEGKEFEKWRGALPQCCGMLLIPFILTRYSELTYDRCSGRNDEEAAEGSGGLSDRDLAGRC